MFKVARPLFFTTHVALPTDWKARPQHHRMALALDMANRALKVALGMYVRVC